jgi:hypothetical protein
MKRHFSNRGEAIAEVTAARVLASRKIAATASFMTQAERRTSPPFWSSRQVGSGIVLESNRNASTITGFCCELFDDRSGLHRSTPLLRQPSLRWGSEHRSCEPVGSNLWN